MSSSPDSNGSELASIIADFLDGISNGRAPDRKAILAAHPDLADDLRAFFADHDKMTQAAAPVRDALSDTHAAPAETFPQPFGDYELLEEIGRGGMGIVYKARQVSLNRVVALKRIRAGQLASPEEVARFRREAEAAAGLDHPHIVPILQVGEHGGQHFFTMKLIEGGNLGAHLEKFADAKATAELMIKIARAVHHAHQRGILHRDLKPGNILIDADGQPHVSDFGLAQPIEKEAKLTQSGAILGTPEYMAPEQARGEKGLTTAADVYGLGAILYVLLTGKPPFQGDYNWETLKKVVEEEPVSPRSLNRKVNRDLEAVCLHCLEKQAKKRYGAAEALAEDLARWRENRPIVARPATRRERLWKWAKRRPAAAALCVVSLLSILALAGGALFHLSRVEGVKGDAKVAVDNSKQQLDSFLAKYLLPAVGGSDVWVGPAERDALIDLASLASDEVRLNCLKTALERYDAAERLKNRPEMVIRAVVGLDSDKRKKCLELVQARFRETPPTNQGPPAKPSGQEASALLAVELGTQDQDILLAAATVYANMFRKSQDKRHLARATELAARLDQDHADQFAPTIAYHIIEGGDLNGLLDVILPKLTKPALGKLLVQAAKNSVNQFSQTSAARLLAWKLIPKTLVKPKVESLHVMLGTFRYGPRWPEDCEPFLKSLDEERPPEDQAKVDPTIDFRGIVERLFLLRERDTAFTFGREPRFLPRGLLDYLNDSGVSRTVGHIDEALIGLNCGFMGVSFRGADLDREPYSKYARIASVFQGSAAERAGLKVGDEIVLMDNQKYEYTDDLLRIIREHNPGEIIEVAVNRGGEAMKIKVTLGQWPMRKTELAFFAELAQTVRDLWPRMGEASRRRLMATVRDRDGNPHFLPVREALLCEFGDDPVPFAEALLKKLGAEDKKEKSGDLVARLKITTSFVKDAAAARRFLAAIHALMKDSLPRDQRGQFADVAVPLVKQLPVSERGERGLAIFAALLADQGQVKDNTQPLLGHVGLRELVQIIVAHATKQEAQQAVKALAAFIERHDVHKEYLAVVATLTKSAAPEAARQLAANLAAGMPQAVCTQKSSWSPEALSALVSVLEARTIDALVLQSVGELDRLNKEAAKASKDGKKAMKDEDEKNARTYRDLLSYLEPLVPAIQQETRKVLLGQLLQEHADFWRVDPLGERLAKQLDAANAKSVLEGAFTVLSADSLYWLGRTLTAAAARLDARERAELGPLILAAFPNNHLWQPLNPNYAPMLELLSEKEIRKAIETAIFEKVGIGPYGANYLKNLEVLSARLDKKEREELKTRYLRLVAAKLAATGLHGLYEELTKNVERMDAKAANDILLFFTNAGKDHELRFWHFSSKDTAFLLALSERCSAEVAAKVVAVLPEWNARNLSSGKYGWVSRKVLAAFVRKLDDSDALSLAREFAATMTEKGTVQRIDVLRALLDRLDRAQAKTLAEPIVNKAADAIPWGPNGPPSGQTSEFNARLFAVFITYLDEPMRKELWKRPWRESAPWRTLLAVSERDYLNDKHMATTRVCVELLDGKDASALAKNLLARQVCRLADRGGPSVEWDLAERMDVADLLDLLKNPLCIGTVGDELLKELGNRFNQKFATVWEFVEWAEVHQPSLNLRAPLGKQ